MDDELRHLSKLIIESIEKEDKEFDFKQNRGYVERNVPAFKLRSFK